MPAPTPPTTGARAGSPSSAKGLSAYLRTREGKIVAGGGAALLVVLVALMRGGRGGAEAGGFLPAAIQPSDDGTLQPLLDQVGGQGGTLAEWIASTDQLNASVRDLLEAQNPLPPSTPKPPAKPPAAGTALQRYGKVGRSYSLRSVAARYAPSSHPDAVEATLRRLVTLNPALKGKTKLPGGFPLRVPK